MLRSLLPSFVPSFFPHLRIHCVNKSFDFEISLLLQNEVQRRVLWIIYMKLPLLLFLLLLLLLDWDDVRQKALQKKKWTLGVFWLLTLIVRCKGKGVRTAVVVAKSFAHLSGGNSSINYGKASIDSVHGARAAWRSKLRLYKPEACDNRANSGKWLSDQGSNCLPETRGHRVEGPSLDTRGCGKLQRDSSERD